MMASKQADQMQDPEQGKGNRQSLTQQISLNPAQLVALQPVHADACFCPFEH